MALRETTRQTAVDVASGTVTYSGETELGRSTSGPFWKLKKTEISGGITTVKYPIGSHTTPSDGYDFAWDKRTEYSYSFVPDGSAPTLSTVTIASNNSDTTKAKVGDTVTLTIVSSEYIISPTVTIAWNTATIVAGVDDLHWTATYVMATGDTAGVVPFTIDFTDIGGITGTQVTAVTGGASVTFDKVRPTAAITYSAPGPYKSGAAITVTATFSEALLDSPIVKIAVSGSNTVAATNMTKSTTTVYTYALVVGAGNGTSTIALSVGTDAAGNLITAAPTSGATFTVDNTVVVFTPTSVLSNNANTARAKSGNIVTAIFTTSETLVANPTVTIGAQAMTFISLVGSTYTYRRTLSGTETVGTCNVLVTGTDLAGNVTTNTNVGNVTTDFTAPTKSAEVFTFSTKNTAGVGTMTFNETIASVPNITWINQDDGTILAGAIVWVPRGGTPTIVDITFTTPTVFVGNLGIMISVTDTTGNTVPFDALDPGAIFSGSYPVT